MILNLSRGPCLRNNHAYATSSLFAHQHLLSLRVAPPSPTSQASLSYLAGSIPSPNSSLVSRFSRPPVTQLSPSRHIRTRSNAMEDQKGGDRRSTGSSCSLTGHSGSALYRKPSSLLPAIDCGYCTLSLDWAGRQRERRCNVHNPTSLQQRWHFQEFADLNSMRAWTPTPGLRHHRSSNSQLPPQTARHS
eukprot:1660712-Rhodomonas_salina.1